MKVEEVVKQQTKTQTKGTKCPDCKSYHCAVEKVTPGVTTRIIKIISMQPIISTYHYRCADCGAGWTQKIKDKK